MQIPSIANIMVLKLKSKHQPETYLTTMQHDKNYTWRFNFLIIFLILILAGL